MPDKPPYFPFYANDFAADGKVEAMTTEQVGAYILLLCKAWSEDPPGTLPADDTVLARWARLSPERWAEVRAGVLAAFHSGTDGRYHQKRMRAEYAKFTRLCRSRREGGRKGAAKRWGDARGDENGSPIGSPIGSPNGKSMAPGSDSDSISASSSSGKKRKGGAGEGEEGFAEFWSSYPKKRGKQDALAAWRRLAPNVSLRGAMLLALERQKRWADWSRENGRYIPNPATWLNGRRWEDGDPQPLGGGHSDLFNQQVEILKDFVGRGGTEADDAK